MSENCFEELCEAVRMSMLPAMPETQWVERAARGGANVECERVQSALGVDFLDHDFNATVQLDHDAYDNATATAVRLLTGWLLLDHTEDFVPNAERLFFQVSKALLPATMKPNVIVHACRGAMAFYCIALSEPRDGRQLEARFASAMELNPGYWADVVDWAVSDLMDDALNEVLDRWAL